LKDDKREIFRAAADAQRIAQMLLGFHPEFAARVQSVPDTPAPRHSHAAVTPTLT
jgi:antirestriction protein ArdC